MFSISSPSLPASPEQTAPTASTAWTGWTGRTRSSGCTARTGRTAVGALLASAALAFLAPTLATAQSGEIPRTPSGRPDMNGIWQALGNHHWDIEPHAARPALQMQPGPVVPVPDEPVLAFGAHGSVPAGWGVVEGGEIPYLPEALERRDANRERAVELDPAVRCYLPGVPRANYMPFPFQIFQSESRFFIAYEFAGATRDVFYQDPGPAQVDSWMGQSVGRWEGDTFVVEVTAQNGRPWLDRSGNHYSYAATVTERWTMLGPDHMRYEATIEDPDTFSRPWTLRLPLYRHVDANARLGRFKCVPFVEELMYGHLRKNPVGENGN